MVDAYEIGIELALQDGVSAGLDAVTKELAALDAAVAASSAGLMALVRTAGLAAEAVAAVGGVRVRAPVTAEPSTAGRGRADEALTPAERAAPAAREEAPGGVAPAAVAREEAVGSAAPATVVREEALGGAAPAAMAVRDRGEDAGSMAGAPDVGAAAPERVVVREASREVERAPVVAPVAVVTRPGERVEVERRADVAAPAMEAAVPVRAVVRDVGLREAGTRGAGVRATEVRDVGPLRVVTATPVGRPDAPVAPAVAPVLRAEVERSLPRRQAGQADRVTEGWSLPGRQEARADRVGAVPLAQGAGRGADEGRRGAAAPMEGADGERARLGPRAMGRDQTVAPMRMAAGPGGGGGTVLLDGRLVGEWLMDRMARDAGRPGAGTTSFDPRQGAAWTPSGIG